MRKAKTWTFGEVQQHECEKILFEMKEKHKKYANRHNASDMSEVKCFKVPKKVMYSNSRKGWQKFHLIKIFKFFLLSQGMNIKDFPVLMPCHRMKFEN